MNRPQLEHILRAAAAITGSDQFVVIGSQAVLGHPLDPPAELLKSFEVDLFTFRSPNDAELIDGTIGEESPFHRTFGYFAHGVGEETAVLPSNWKDRLVAFTTPATGGATGLCLDLHDLAVSKLIAGREKDLSYVQTMLGASLVDRKRLLERLSQTTLTDALRGTCADRISRLSSP